MSKTLVVIFALTLLAVANSQAAPGEKPCWGEDCAFNAAGNPDEPADITEIVPTIDTEVRRAYWYYLRGARLLYQANIDTPERFLNFFIYRNVVGTFLVIASWNKESQAAEINTFVRLGNGYSEDIQTPYSPVDIEPFIISLRLKQGEFLIEMDEDGNFRINGELVNVDTEEEEPMTQEELDAKTAAIDIYVRERYWYYLRGAAIVHVESLLTTQRVYSLLTYINIVGTFLVIGSCDADDNIQVNTFVRLGAGSADKIQPIVIQPSVVELI